MAEWQEKNWGEDDKVEEGEITNIFYNLGKEIGSNPEMLGEFMTGMLDSTFQVEFQTCHEYYPSKATVGSAGFDLYAPQSVRIAPWSVMKIGMGIKLFFNNCTQHAQLMSRSGLACHYGIEVAGNAVIDRDYTDEIICPLKNSSDYEYEVRAGDRICQIIFYPFHQVKLVCKDTNKQVLPRKDERSGGFGSTGK